MQKAVAAPLTSLPEQTPSDALSVMTSVDSRHAIAVDALTQNKPFAIDAARQYLNTLGDTFEGLALREPANGLLDAKVLEAIDAFEPSLCQYRQFVDAAARSSLIDQMVYPLVRFFDSALVFKRGSAEHVSECVLWADAYRFIIRELFLTTMGILIERQAWTTASALMDAAYEFGAPNQDGEQRFVVCDGYVKTLDEFRNRRLQMNRLSVSSDLLRQRVDAAYCDFNALMQADFILCLRSLVCEPSFFVRWYPRTLVYAEQYQMTGFDLFITGADPGRFGPLATLFNVSDMGQLVARFEAVRDAWALDRWEIGGCPLDFVGFMGQRNAALRH